MLANTNGKSMLKHESNTNIFERNNWNINPAIRATICYITCCHKKSWNYITVPCDASVVQCRSQGLETIHIKTRMKKEIEFPWQHTQMSDDCRTSAGIRIIFGPSRYAGPRSAQRPHTMTQPCNSQTLIAVKTPGIGSAQGWWVRETRRILWSSQGDTALPPATVTPIHPTQARSKHSQIDWQYTLSSSCHA